MITNGLPISKIVEFTGLGPKDVYGKLDFIYERVTDVTARREGIFEGVNWTRAGRRFATDSQTLHLNWPNKRTKAEFAVHHLCTAHANSGYIVAAHVGLDPAVSLPEIETMMMASGDFQKPRAFREQGRVWSETEFKAYLDRITRNIAMDVDGTLEVDVGLQLPHKGCLLRQDIMQMAHAFLLRKILGRGSEQFVFNLDADAGLSGAFISAFAPWILQRRADVVGIQFDKHQTNDQRNRLVSEGKGTLELMTGISRSQWPDMPASHASAVIDEMVMQMLKGSALSAPFEWPFHTKSEPHRQIRLLTDHIGADPARRARQMRLATLRSVDAYFHKVRSNLRFAARPGHTPSGNGRTWDRHDLYNRETIIKIIEI